MSNNNTSNTMNTSAYIAARTAADTSAADMVSSIRGLQMAKGYDTMDASAYALGYLESFLARNICELPAKYREQFIAEMRLITEDKLISTKELA